MNGKTVPGLTLIAVLVTACGDSSGPGGRIESVDMLLAEICQLAAGCPGVSSSAVEVQNCPSGIRSELNQSQLAQLETFTTYSEAQQDRILQCIGTSICGRFGGSVANLSDSDVLEPYGDCLSSPAAIGLGAVSSCGPGQRPFTPPERP